MSEWAWSECERSPTASPLVGVLRKTLGTKKDGIVHGHWLLNTPLDRLFSRLATSYRTFPNKFLRAELAEKLLIATLLDEDSQSFRSESDLSQADFEWFDGEKWNPVSVKYKGPNKSGPPPFSSQLSALAWSKNASGNAPEGLTCDMLIIWDSDFDEHLKPPKRGLGKANYRRGLVVVTPEQFNPYYVPVSSELQNKTDSAFKIQVCKPALEREKNWVRNGNNESIDRVDDPHLRIVFDVR